MTLKHYNQPRFIHFNSYVEIKGDDSNIAHIHKCTKYVRDCELYIGLMYYALMQYNKIKK